jgi:uncharacterized protein
MFQHLKLNRPLLKQVLYSGLGGSIGILGVMFTVALYVVETLIRPKKHTPFDEYTVSPYELDLPAEAVVFPPQQGNHQVSGWYIPAPSATTTILVCPGYRTPKTDVLGLCAKLWRAGHNVLVFEYYGHGTVVGASVTLGYREMNDFLGAVAFAKERAPEARLGVIAFSMGASVAIMCSARSNDVEAIAADSAFATHASAVDYNFRRAVHIPFAPFIWIADYLLWWRAGYHFHQVEPLREIGRLAPRPILIIQGGKDTIVDPQDAMRLYKAAGEPKELWMFPTADHCGAYFVDRITYTRKVLDFFEMYLKKPHLQLVDTGDEESARSTGSAGSTSEDLSEAS